jgi:hypothetical protein
MLQICRSGRFCVLSGGNIQVGHAGLHGAPPSVVPFALGLSGPGPAPLLRRGPQQFSGIRRCIERFDAQPVDSHHRISRRFLSPNSGLRFAMEVILAGGPMSDSLNDALVPFEVLGTSAFACQFVGHHLQQRLTPKTTFGTAPCWFVLIS